MILVLRAVAPPIVALKFWERTSAAPLLSRTIWGSAVQRQSGTRSRSIPSHRSRSIRAPTLPEPHDLAIVKRDYVPPHLNGFICRLDWVLSAKACGFIVQDAPLPCSA